MKQAFQTIPPDSSNNLDIGAIYREMLEKGIIVGIFTLILITPIISGTADAEVNIALNEYYTPGSDIVISGAGEPLASITVNISDSVGLIATISTSSDELKQSCAAPVPRPPQPITPTRIGAEPPANTPALPEKSTAADTAVDRLMKSRLVTPPVSLLASFCITISSIF